MSLAGVKDPEAREEIRKLLQQIADLERAVATLQVRVSEVENG